MHGTVTALEVRTSPVHGTVTPPEVQPCMHGDVPLLEFKHLAFTRMPGESYRRKVRSLLLLGLCDVRVSSANYFPCMLFLYETCWTCCFCTKRVGRVVSVRNVLDVLFLYETCWTCCF